MDEKSKTSSLRLLLIPFGILFSLTLFLLVITGLEVFNIIVDPIEHFKNYPFGTEQGYPYASKETYFATTIIEFYIFSQALIVSAFLYHSKQRAIAIFFVSAPLFLKWLILTNFSTFH